VAVLGCSSEGANTRLSAEEFRLLSSLICERTGLHFAEPKRESFAAKIGRRMAALSIDSPRDYYQRLALGGDRSAQELVQLAEILANHETFFFREASQLEAFLSVCSPALVAAARAERRAVRVLSLGCSSGEEPYTLAILEREQRVQGLDVRFEILGADLCSGVLERAGAGVYGPGSFRRLGLDGAVPGSGSTHQEYFERYFDAVSERRFRLKELVRRSVSFHQANMLSAEDLEKLGQFDAVLCRNVFIYFEESALVRALRNIRAVLRPDGVLLLGHSESLLGLSERFEPLWLGGGMAYKPVAR
jgi:chemotaxis protein methyltransferase CheR